MTVKSILDEKGAGILSIGSDRTLLEAVKVLEKEGVGALVVSSPEKALAGIISERDVVRGLCQNGQGVLQDTVAEHMTSQVITIAPEKSVVEAMEIMTEKRIRHLPVMQEGALIGLISIGDVVKRRISMTEAEAQALKEYISTG
ncbi:MAG: CBS domain-containing protein [Parvibaculales bacterium]